MPRYDVALTALAVVLMLGGAIMLLFTSVHPGIAIPLIAVGIALTALLVDGKRRHRRLT